MGLLSIIRKQKLKEHELRVLVLGLDGGGKTSVVTKILHEDTSQIAPTMGFNISTIHHSNFTLNVWDIGGQSTIRAFWDNYFMNCDCLVWCIDANSLERLQESFSEFRKLMDEERLVGSGLLILVNKIDLVPTNEIETTVQLIRKTLKIDEITNHNVGILPVSAITGKNIDRILDWIVSEASERLYIL
ncbi:Arf family GTPase [Saccharomycopsis crataegensis]|uniref:Arf family GTPase n=1 Tax=Saccharomycopsis crataegensis TaxID=43959 RepID=A0AAV5QIQ0_9ASCO|nr:Arf family GTPase [Saccharomycopsis crataegensis]